ncbi:hypothetical protein CR162_18575 [Pseudoroseomonas rhizosphaerae]|uniref:Uncharacterized protein n=1 Tax=Teichococcus rhizosphaerae TaxID=1335062 RepID=A0A2C7A711_9PROT|nr:ELWxxDGT repeat protein [Pseudoroseomonas rhizosphaerae]PHK93413.1 hypothetical protein CR162_18575 [Pseudoroseomonas rhizosphaerae]
MVASNTYLYTGFGEGAPQRGIWLLDVDTGERSLVKGISAAGLVQTVGGRVLFTGTDAEHGVELWVTDGTTEGTVLLKDIHPGGMPSNGTFPSEFPQGLKTLSDGRVLFTANDGEHGWELWVTDGTPDGTRMVLDLVPGAGGNQPRDLVSLPNGKATFVALGADGHPGLWVTDGTAEGTKEILDAFPYFTANQDNRAVALGEGQALYRVEFDAKGQGGQYWVTDGTAEGTHLLDVPWDDGRAAYRTHDMVRTEEGDVIVPVAGTADGSVPPALWIVEGADASARHLLDFPAGTSFSGLTFTNLGAGQTLIRAGGADANLLWVTDGTEAGTLRVEDGWTGAPASSYVPVGDGKALHIEQEGSTGPTTVWLVDGTDRVLLMEASADNPPGDDVNARVLADGRTLFIARELETAREEIWITDGTAAGTKLIGAQVADPNFVPITLPEAEAPTTPETPVAPHHEWSAANALFDVSFYLEHNPDVAAAGADAYQHFLQFGAAEGRDPNAFFDMSFYLNQNPDVLAAGVNALEHYMTSGWQEGRAASFSFDGAAYLTANDDVARAGMNPLEHYLHYGEVEHRAAPQAMPHDTGPQNPLVDALFYFSTYADVAREGVDPTQHFMTSGWQEGRDPNAFFDTDWYLAHNTDVATAQVNPLEHYLQFGAGEGRDPSAAFDGEAYLAHNPDVAEAGMNPLVHYLEYGIAEHRDAFAA